MVRDCEVTWGDDPPDRCRHALAAHRVPGLEIDGLRGTSACPGRYENVVTTG